MALVEAKVDLDMVENNLRHAKIKERLVGLAEDILIRRN